MTKKRLIAAAVLLVLAALATWRFAVDGKSGKDLAKATTTPQDGFLPRAENPDTRFNAVGDPASEAKESDALLTVEDSSVKVPKSKADALRLSYASIQPGSTVARSPQHLGLTAGSVQTLTTDVKPTWNLAKVAAGTEVTVAWKDSSESEPVSVEFKLSETRALVAYNDGEAGWRSEFRDEEVQKRTVAFAGVVTSNLWSSAALAGMDSQIIQKLAEVFAWQIDFNREVQVNDRWRLSVEQIFVKDKAIGYGEIIAAEYENVGNVSTALRFAANADSIASYYTPDGNSLRRMFLKSPLKFGRVTSGFTTNRFHPILKINRAHNGVDYGAPIGTPIMAVGNGTIEYAANRGTSGNAIAIRHNAIYETQYKHMSAFAAGIRAGTRVEMGQVIGYVGQTGLATGPHLHFEFHDKGRYVDPQGLRFPAADPVPEASRAAFLSQANTALSELPLWSTAVLSQKRSGDSGSSQNE